MAVVSNVQFCNNPLQVLLKVESFRKDRKQYKTDTILQHKGFSNSELSIEQAVHINMIYVPPFFSTHSPTHSSKQLLTSLLAASSDLSNILW